MRVLITGSHGFVGRRFVGALADHELTCVDINHPTGAYDARDFFRDNDSRYDLVIHLAAVVGGRQLIDGQPLALAVDLSIDAELFNWAFRTRPGALVYFSSSAAYPVDLQGPDAACRLAEDDIDLDHVRTPDAVYGWAKLTGEVLARHAAAVGIPVHVIRPFSGYGHDQDLDYPFPSFIARAARCDDPFDIWGDGEQVRDFVHIQDVVDGTLAAVEAGLTGPLNLGTGRGVSFNELAALVTAEAGYSPAWRHFLDAPVGVRHRVADVTLMRSIFEPRFTLEQGIAMALGQARAAA